MSVLSARSQIIVLLAISIAMLLAGCSGSSEQDKKITELEDEIEDLKSSKETTSTTTPTAAATATATAAAAATATAKTTTATASPSPTATATATAKTKPKVGEDTTFNSDNYSPECMVDTLGDKIAAQIRFNDRAPTEKEMATLEKECLVSDMTTEQAHQEDEHDNKPDTENVVQKEVEQVASKRQCIRDDHGHALGPDCNVASKPLPLGFVAAELIATTFPGSTHKLPENIECETFEAGQCAELRWEPVSDLLAGEFTAIEIAPTNPDIIFAGVDSNDMSIYKSIDAGKTWQLFDVTGHTSGIAISPSDPNIVLYTSLESAVRRTVDGGWNWESVLEIVTETGNNPFTAITFAPDDPNVVYTANVPGPSRGGFYPPQTAQVYKSKNAGLDWSLVGICECGSIKHLVVQRGTSNVIWAAGDGGVRVSRDGGQTWSGNMIAKAISDNLGEVGGQDGEFGAIGLALRPGDNQTILAASSMAGMYRSTDGGQTWVEANTGLKTPLLHHVMFAPNNSNVAYLATHDGVYRSGDAGQSWTLLTQGWTYNFFTPIAVDPNDADIVYVGTATEVYTTHPKHFNPGMHEGEGLYKTIDGGKAWSRSDKGIYEGKLAQMGTHPLLPFNLWVGGESGRGAFFTPDGGDTWLFSPFNGAHYPMVFEFSRSFPTIQYLTAWTHGGELSKSTDTGATWFLLTAKIEAGISEATKSRGLILDEPAKFHLHGLAVAPSDPNIVYVGSVHDNVYPDVGFTLFGAHIFKSVDGGTSFTEMSDGFPIWTYTAINAIVVHPSNPDIAYVMTTLHESVTAIGIYKTTDGARSWVSVNNGLDLETNDLQMDPLDPDTLYAATQTGVYKTTDGAKTWQLSSIGLPTGSVIDLAIDPINPLVLYAITPEHVYRTKDGAGLWNQVDLGLPLDDSTDPIAAGKAPKIALGESAGHLLHGGHFAQDRTLEIDATGRIIYVVIKTSVDDGAVRHLYRAIQEPLLPVSYEFKLEGESILVESTSHTYDVLYNKNSQELSFIIAGPTGTTGHTKVIVPSQFLSSPYSVKIDGVDVSFTNNAGVFSFEYAHIGRSTVVISGSN